MKLVIVESPTKARTIQQFLSKDFEIVPSYGHVRDLPRSTLGIDIENDFTPKYVIPRASQKRVNALKKQAQKADEIILATDEDREGEAIAWHIVQLINGPKKDAPAKISSMKRIVFHEITREAIENALANPRLIDMKLVDAQQARRVLDRLVGYQLSPFLWQKIARGLSAGRVQSAALRLIVDRERERDNFAPQEYWTIEAELANSKGLDFRARLIQQDGKEIEKLDINNKKSAEEIKNALVDADWSVKTVNKKERRLNPPPPFRTSTLQQEAWRKLKFSAKQTMLLAQQLYEGVEIDGAAVGLITYMRTDSSNLAEEFLNSTQKFVAETLGPQYVQGSRRFAGKTKGAQEAHEAIRPTSPFHAPDSLKGKLDARQWKLYDMIWRRTVASQLPQAIFDTTSVDISATAKKSEYVFRANGSVLQFDGFLKVWPIKSDDEQLPELEVDEKLKYIDLITEQHFTEPPPRYTEASLIKALEENGIGRPSTYAPIISTIQGRNYVEKDEARRLKPTEIGLMVNDIIVANFPEIVDLKFTATMEEDLDKIAGGKMAWVPVIKEFYDPFSKHLAEKYETVEKKELVTETTDEICEKCGKPMIIRFGRFGKFMACSGFPECRNTKTLKKGLGVSCPSCLKGEIIERKSKRGRFFYGCSSYPDCTFALWEKPTGEKCPTCGSLLVQNKSGKRCSNKECLNAKGLEK
ncbi:MAG: DNA topoisomerase I [Candidatus Terrybacteria bacterium RIFCSPLOWO2_01_FULL_44_24]|uniref:DNA topoisomerase 1 n=1 Tax=Candidatus Terrybacteria bacterium RIFCSPHIGHO2_01_FULL_43_35 TaxID=1802361 RepID=A0A1G2PE51_9BACT|nr:MAG: DNA topoisomerase I [Candidatus Terrybacteria bacterium RIFCSPHIGHO2_01_FULL_43_35]OHA50824.1 MAG: DNA topoisomerase I [Candidatus Terrybacteria bacterium RIFCSPLOWO2_01_FULL_44_24]